MKKKNKGGRPRSKKLKPGEKPRGPQLSPVVRAAEKAAITQFMLDRVGPRKGGRLPIASIFAAYEAWRKDGHLSPTELEVDGFGRLFPAFYTRRSLYWAPVRHALNCVVGVSLK